MTAATPHIIDRTTPITVKPVPWLLAEAVRRFPDQPAMDFLGRQTSYQQLAGQVERAARGLQRLGVKKGDRVALCLPNTPYYIICFYAVLKIGGVVVNLNPLYVERELRNLIDDSGAKLLVTIDLAQITRKLEPLLGSSALEKLIICSMLGILPPLKRLGFSLLKAKELAKWSKDERHLGFTDLVGDFGPAGLVEIDAEQDLAVLQYTGGTTGVPKAAMLTHANLSGNVDQLARLVPDMPIGTGSMMVLLPLFHVFAMTVAMNLAIYFAAEMILLPRYDKDQLRKTIKRKRPTMFPGVPTIYNNINEAAATETWDLGSIRYCISGGAPLPMEVRQRFESLSGCCLVEGYGLSETSPVVTCNPMGAVRDGSIGPALPGTVVEIRSLDDPKKLLGAGEKGEVCVKGPQVMKGYWGRADETANVFCGDSLRTGDVGYIDRDGYVFLVDRIKDVILSGGYNVYPRIIEEALYEHPSIAEAVVIGVPDSHRGQVPKAFIKLRDGHELPLEQLQTFLEERLSTLERPRKIEFRDELPKTLVGKLSKKELVAEELAKADLTAGKNKDKKTAARG
jgi:long-chain acyl-CoA synthetase